MMTRYLLKRTLVLSLLIHVAVLFLRITTSFPEPHLLKSKIAEEPRNNVITRITQVPRKTDDNLRPNYIFNCTNINQIHITHKDMGGGRSKIVDFGIYKGQKVVIKRIAPMKKPPISLEKRELIFLKEILLREQLDHPGLIRMLGYCVRSIYSDSYKGYHRYGGIIAVYEHGIEIDLKNRSLSVVGRLNIVLQATELLLYLQHSPLGSLILNDFAVHHFLMVDGNVKLIDMDYVHNIEPPCKKDSDCLNNVKCFKSINETCDPYNGCQTGLCVGHNARHGLNKIREHFINDLLNQTYVYVPERIYQMIKNVSVRLNNHVIDAKQLTEVIKHIIMESRLYEKS